VLLFLAMKRALHMKNEAGLRPMKHTFGAWIFTARFASCER